MQKKGTRQRASTSPAHNTIPCPIYSTSFTVYRHQNESPRGTCTRKDQSMLAASRQSKPAPPPYPKATGQIYTAVRVRSSGSSDRLFDNSAMTRSYERKSLKSCQRRWTRPHSRRIRKNKLKESAPFENTHYANCTPKIRVRYSLKECTC